MVNATRGGGWGWRGTPIVAVAGRRYGAYLRLEGWEGRQGRGKIEEEERGGEGSRGQEVANEAAQGKKRRGERATPQPHP